MTPEDARRIDLAAAKWQRILQNPTAKDCCEFANWLRFSPHHINSFLLDTALELEISLGPISQGRKCGPDEFVRALSSNVVPVSVVCGPCGQIALLRVKAAAGDH